MKIRSFIRKNKFFTIISVSFLIWIVFLIILSITGQRTVIFYDTLGQEDATSEFTSKMPLLRYFVEPFMAIANILEYEFTWMFLFLIFYPILRGIYLILKKKGRFSSKKYIYITYPIVDILYFCFKVLCLSILIVAIYILIGYIIQGYFFVGRYFMIPIQLAVHLSMILIFFKISFVVLKLFHPKLSLDLSRKFQKNKGKRRKKVQTIKRETIFYVGIGVILLGVNIVLISTPFPPHEIIPTVPLEDDEFLFDFHVHTTFSDGWLTVEERINWYMQQGISGAAFSDHDNIRGATMAQKYVEDHDLNFIVFIAEEWTQNAENPGEIHMNYFGLAEEIVPLESYSPSGPLAMNASDTINYVKAHGGYITVNHYNYDPNPSGGYGVPYSLNQLKDWGVDGFEITNGGSYGGKYIQIRNYCLANNLTCIGGSDIHSNEDLNTFIKLKLDDPTNLTINNIFETLKKNEHEVIAICFHPKVVDFPSDLNDFGFYILEDFLNYVLSIDINQGLSWIIWSGLVYLLIVLTYRKIKYTNLKVIKNKIYKTE
ncbi:MAG: PHP domain-containing protein [Promethearchaeota archaeon]